jgi:hypothetical protein
MGLALAYVCVMKNRYDAWVESVRECRPSLTSAAREYCKHDITGVEQ